MQRRAFLKTTIGAAAGLVGAPRPASASEAEIELRPGDAGPVISPHLYGHFIEHLGGVIYDGIWVGPDSKVPNLGGIRQQFVDDMKRIGAPNLRWPGGCFADGYHWRDGVGPRSQRPRTYNFWQPTMPEGIDATETNHFGTHEFMRLCRLIGAEPYLAVNVGSGTPREFYDWVLYCNGPAGTVTQADQRAANGDPSPFGVKYWGVGNESWGCGGLLTAEEYAAEYSRFVAQFPRAYTKAYLIGVGPNASMESGHPEWTRRFFEALEPRLQWPPLDAWAMHFYTSFGRTASKGNQVSPQEWYDVLHEGARLESLIEQHWKIMGEFDKEHRVKLIIDEWGVWHARGSEIKPAYLFSQQGSLRDALHAAMSFDIFNRHSGKIAMTNLAQTINCLHSLFAADGDRFIRTPTYYVFDMYRPHMGAQQVPLEIRTQAIQLTRQGTSATLFGLAGSASLDERRLTLTLVNPALDAAITSRVRIKGAQASEAQGRVLTHSDRAAANTFASPEEVAPKSLSVSLSGGEIQVTIPAKSVVALQLNLS